MKNTFSFLHLKHRIVLWFLMIFPGIRLIALCNSRAMGKHSENSDIDLFIITRSGQLWTARFFVTLISSILGVRRQNTHGLTKWGPEYIKKTKDKFCLSFFITEDAMNLDAIRLQPDDPYLDRWIVTLIPLIDKKNTLSNSSVTHWRIFLYSIFSSSYITMSITFSCYKRYTWSRNRRNTRRWEHSPSRDRYRWYPESLPEWPHMAGGSWFLA
jgi:predicted nucleotidyltransferase